MWDEDTIDCISDPTQDDLARHFARCALVIEKLR